MASKRVLKDARDVAALADRLAGTRALTSSREEAWAMAHSLSELEESFSTSVDKLLPQLVKPNVSHEELTYLLAELGEELRHILYHIENSKYYGYLLPPRVEV